MARFNINLKYVVALALLAAVIASARNLGKKNRKGKNKPPVQATVDLNDPVCARIVDPVVGWWSSRETTKTRADINIMDALCDVFSTDEDACAATGADVQATRASFVSQSLITADDAAMVRCAMVGAGNRRCVANPCNSLNDGRCDLHQTAGFCRWFSKEEATNFASFGIKYGCFRNPCHMGGMDGQTEDECKARSVDGLFQCTWCSGRRDPNLAGMGVGCQLTTLSTQSACESVNDLPYADAVYNLKGNRKCQCAYGQSTFCAEAVDSRAGSYTCIKNCPP